jgi:hypothetical protein
MRRVLTATLLSTFGLTACTGAHTATALTSKPLAGASSPGATSQTSRDGGGATGESTGCGGGLAAVSGTHVVGLASCAGEVGMTHPRPALSVHKGSTITLKGLSEDYAAPNSTRPKVVALVARGRTTATLKAMSTGTSTITLATWFCLGIRSQHCPVLNITVTR